MKILVLILCLVLFDQVRSQQGVLELVTQESKQLVGCYATIFDERHFFTTAKCASVLQTGSFSVQYVAEGVESSSKQSSKLK